MCCVQPEPTNPEKPEYTAEVKQKLEEKIEQAVTVSTDQLLLLTAAPTPEPTGYPTPPNYEVIIRQQEVPAIIAAIPFQVSVSEVRFNKCRCILTFHHRHAPLVYKPV